jgi:hypothetical protein
VFGARIDTIFAMASGAGRAAITALRLGRSTARGRRRDRPVQLNPPTKITELWQDQVIQSRCDKHARAEESGLREALIHGRARRGSAFDSTPNHVNMTVQLRLSGLEER